MCNACGILQLPKGCDVNDDKFVSFSWVDGSLLCNVKSISIYKTLMYNANIFNHVNDNSYLDLSPAQWGKMFKVLWSSPLDPKKKTFRSLLMLDKLPIRFDYNKDDLCNICKVKDSIRHIFFDCIISKEFWLIFWLILPIHINILDVVTRFIRGMKKDTNHFWNLLPCKILWYLWRIRNI